MNALCEEIHCHRPSPSTILPSVLPAGGEWGSQMQESPRTWLIAQGGQDSMGPRHTNINKFQPKQSPELAVSRDLRRKREPLDQSRGEKTGGLLQPTEEEEIAQ